MKHWKSPTVHSTIRQTLLVILSTWPLILPFDIKETKVQELLFPYYSKQKYNGNNTDFMFVCLFVCMFDVHCSCVLQTKEMLYSKYPPWCFWFIPKKRFQWKSPTVYVYLRIILKHFKQVQKRARWHAPLAVAARFFFARVCAARRRTFVVETPCKAPCETDQEIKKSKILKKTVNQ